MLWTVKSLVSNCRRSCLQSFLLNICLIYHGEEWSVESTVFNVGPLATDLYLWPRLALVEVHGDQGQRDHGVAGINVEVQERRVEIVIAFHFSYVRGYLPFHSQSWNSGQILLHVDLSGVQMELNTV